MGYWINPDLERRAALHEDWTFRFGDPVQNMAASEDNPLKYGFFVEMTNKGGARVTDAGGRFWVVSKDALEPHGWTPPEDGQ